MGRTREWQIPTWDRQAVAAATAATAAEAQQPQLQQVQQVQQQAQQVQPPQQRTPLSTVRRHEVESAKRVLQAE